MVNDHQLPVDLEPAAKCTLPGAVTQSDRLGRAIGGGEFDVFAVVSLGVDHVSESICSDRERVRRVERASARAEARVRVDGDVRGGHAGSTTSGSETNAIWSPRAFRTAAAAGSGASAWTRSTSA